MGLLQRFVIIFAVRIVQLVLSTEDDGPVFQTNLGKIQGSIMTSDGGLEFFAFRGIPFAKPPVNDLRFKEPQALTVPWGGVLDATEEGPVCIQYDFFKKELAGDEDCLYLNVYTPKFEDQVFADPLPVMMWIHGGAFFSGTGASSLYGPQRLMDKTGIILVTINYRLGPFGFLATMDEHSPGNYGMLDQVLALKWIRDSIAVFGGDSKQVTIFGESAGGSAVGLHVISPLSEGLFHAAIIQSGSPLSDRVTPFDHSSALNDTKNLASLLRCPIDDNATMMKCLMGLPSVDIVAETVQLLKESLNDECMLIVFRPVVDKVRGPNAFLPDSPLNMMVNRQFNAIPIMNGVTKDEGILFLGFCSEGPGGIASFDKSNLPATLSASMPSLFKNEEQWKRVTHEIISSYFKNVDETDVSKKIAALNDLFSDSILNYKVDVLNDFFAKYDVPSYAYKFTYRGKQSMSENGAKDMVAHADDLQYLFRCTFFKSTTLSDEEKQMSDVMLTLWTNFAKTNVPSLHGSDLEQPAFKWASVSSNSYKYLDLNLKPTMVDGHLSINYNIWKNAYSEVYKDEL